MPEIAAAANVASAVKALPPSDNSAASAESGATSTGPFAAVLQKHIDTPEQADTGTATANDATANDAATAVLAAFLPLLMGSAAMAAGPQGAPTGQGNKKTDTGDPGSDAATSVPLTALAAVPAAAITPIAGSAAATTGETATAISVATPSATTPAATTAILAAATDSATPDAKTDAKSDQTFDVLSIDNSHDVGQQVVAAHADVVTAAPAPATPDRSPVVASAVGTPAWDSEIGNRLVWMAHNHDSRADLVLTPPQLGKIEISVTMSGDHATATFVAANPDVRDAIQNAIPRLREILANAGVTLGQTQVGSESQRQGTDQNRSESPTGTAVMATGGLHASAAGIASWTAAGRGLVDVFA